MKKTMLIPIVVLASVGLFRHKPTLKPEHNRSFKAEEVTETHAHFRPVPPKTSKPSSSVSAGKVSENVALNPKESHRTPQSSRLPTVAQSQQVFPNQVPKSVGAPNENSAYENADQQLLAQALVRAHVEGSKVAYIGGVAALIAFDPHFIQQFQTPNGKVDYRPQRIDSVQPLRTPQGIISFSVQRVPYPLPPGSESNYELLNRAIIKAAEDDAMIINLATPGLQRQRLQSSIQFARDRGSVVVMVSR